MTGRIPAKIYTTGDLGYFPSLSLIRINSPISQHTINDMKYIYIIISYSIKSFIFFNKLEALLFVMGCKNSIQIALTPWSSLSSVFILLRQ